jgi:hypothetical protein
MSTDDERDLGITQVEELRDRLAQIGEDLADLAVSLLGRALDTTEEHERVQLANLEKRVTKARRAVEKATDCLN